MILKSFQETDIEKATLLTKLVWGDFYDKESSDLQNLINSFTLEYYNLNPKYSFCLFDEELKGFLSAFTKDDFVDKSELFKEKLKALKTTDEKKIAINFYEYLEFCSTELKNFMTNSDVFLGLFVSTQKGGGKLLFNKLIEQCKENQKNSIVLWTDTTCNYQYYEKNNFTLIKKLTIVLNEQPIETLFFRKSLSP